MTHRFLHVHEMDKVKVARRDRRAASTARMVFVRTKRGADRLVAPARSARACDAGAIHGDLRQTAREKALADFSDGQARACSSPPTSPPAASTSTTSTSSSTTTRPRTTRRYLHRSGRTARAGETGVVVTLVLWDQELEVRRIQKRLGVKQPIVEVFSNDPRLADLRAWVPDRT